MGINTHHAGVQPTHNCDETRVKAADPQCILLIHASLKSGAKPTPIRPIHAATASILIAKVVLKSQTTGKRNIAVKHMQAPNASLCFNEKYVALIE